MKILGGNPTEKEAKKASRSARAAELVKAGTHTQAQAAREVGISEPAVHKELTKTSDNTNKVNSSPAPKPPMTRLTLDPSLTAANIIRKMGEEYAREIARRRGKARLVALIPCARYRGNGGGSEARERNVLSHLPKNEEPNESSQQGE